MKEVGIIMEIRSSFPRETNRSVWLVLDRYDPEEDGPNYPSHPDAVELCTGLSEKAACELAEKLKELFENKGFDTIISIAADE